MNRDRQAAGNGVVDVEVLALEYAVLTALPRPHFGDIRFDAVLAALLSDERERELRADDRNIGTKLEQERDRADVVLVRVREDQCLHLVEPVLDMAQVGQDQVDAGFVVRREQHAAVDDQQPAEVLENRHVPADFADPAQGGDPQAARGQWPRWSEL
jgi:hypothetical protein